MRINWKQIEKNRKQHVLNKNHDYDSMTGEEFENYVAYLLNKTGYTNIKVTSTSGDYGVDILAYKNGKKYAYQCKRYSEPVGNHAVQEVFSGKAYYDADEAVVITTNYFTPAAINTANKLNVYLVNRDELNKLIKQIQRTEVQVQKKPQQTNDSTEKLCADYSPEKILGPNYYKEKLQRPIGDYYASTKKLNSENNTEPNCNSDRLNRPIGSYYSPQKELDADYSQEKALRANYKKERSRITSQNAKYYIRKP